MRTSRGRPPSTGFSRNAAENQSSPIPDPALTKAWYSASAAALYSTAGARLCRDRASEQDGHHGLRADRAAARGDLHRSDDPRGQERTATSRLPEGAAPEAHHPSRRSRSEQLAVLDAPRVRDLEGRVEIPGRRRPDRPPRVPAVAAVHGGAAPPPVAFHGRCDVDHARIDRRALPSAHSG